MTCLKRIGNCSQITKPNSTGWESKEKRKVGTVNILRVAMEAQAQATVQMRVVAQGSKCAEAAHFSNNNKRLIMCSESHPCRSSLFWPSWACSPRTGVSRSRQGTVRSAANPTMRSDPISIRSAWARKMACIIVSGATKMAIGTSSND